MKTAAISRRPRIARRRERSRFASLDNRCRLVLQCLEDRTLLSPGALDLTFNDTGKTTVPFDLGGSDFDQARSVAIQPDGKIVLAGAAEIAPLNFDFALTRINGDGTLDSAFGGGGGKSLFGYGDDDGATGVAVQPDGKIVVVGSTNSPGHYDFAVARLNSDGFTDTTFGNGGANNFSFAPGSMDFATGVALQPDGKIVVVGFSNLSGNFQITVARLNANGTHDTTFGTGGLAIIGTVADDRAAGVVLQPDGKIVVAGTINVGGNQDFLVARLNANGSLDTGFGTGGQRIVEFKSDDSRGAGLALQADGKIVVAGTVDVSAINTDFGVIRLNANGSLDTSYGVNGKSVFGYGLKDTASGVAVQPSGKTVVAGTTNSAGNNDMVVSRLNPNGLLDASFGSGGQNTIAFDLGGTKSDLAYGVALQADGKIVIAGHAEVPLNNADFAVARLEGMNMSFMAVAGAPNRVQVFNLSGTSLGTFVPFAGYNDAVAVAFADFNSDGTDDLITSAVIGNPAVKVYSGAKLGDGTFFLDPESQVLASGFAYGINFNVGANIAAGDVNGDGYADLITGAVPGNPHVKVFDGVSITTSGTIPTGDDPSLLAQGFAYGVNFNVGANVAAGDINGDGLADIITGATAGNPHTRIFDAKAILVSKNIPTSPDASVLAEFFPYALQFNVGAFVAAGDYNRDGFADVITGASIGNPEVRVFSGKDMAQGTFNLSASLLDFFFAFEQGQNIGVSVAASDFTGDGHADVLAGTRSGTPRHRVFQNNLPGEATLLPGFDVIDSTFSGGLYVGA